MPRWPGNHIQMTRKWYPDDQEKRTIWPQHDSHMTPKWSHMRFNLYPYDLHSNSTWSQYHLILKPVDTNMDTSGHWWTLIDDRHRWTLMDSDGHQWTLMDTDKHKSTLDWQYSPQRYLWGRVFLPCITVLKAVFCSIKDPQDPRIWISEIFARLSAICFLLFFVALFLKSLFLRFCDQHGLNLGPSWSQRRHPNR